MEKPNCPLLSSPFSSPNITALLKLKILSWTQETGLPVLIRVQIDNRIFNLHKHLLCSKSGYFKTKLEEEESNEIINLPLNFPGGSETFEMIALFIYGSSTLISPFNIASLRCAAEFLQMTEEFCHGNLCERFDIYLNHVVLQNWDHVLIVLWRSRNLVPLAEDLLIVSRCIESLAFMACMEVLDPEKRRDHPVVGLFESLVGKNWSSGRERVKDILNQEIWINDLIDLPFGYFKRLIGSLRRQGMKEKYVVPIIVFFANKWLLSNNYESSDAADDDDVLMGVLHMLPMRDQVMIPIGFYFDLISISMKLKVKDEYINKLMDRITHVLHLATVEDLLYPKKKIGEESVSMSFEFCLMKTIFSKYSSSLNQTSSCSINSSIVAELWDCYLSRVASDSSLDPKRFAQLIETVPVSTRQSHDNLYRSLDTYLLAHPGLSQEEKGSICKYLNCQKLSQEVCVEAVQNELMPLRFIVQALFIQQIDTHKAFKDCSDSFRSSHYDGDQISGSLLSSRYANSRTHHHDLVETPEPLGLLLQEATALEFESTSFRILNLEQELMSLKKSLRLQNIVVKAEQVVGKKSKKTIAGGKKNRRIGEVAACIDSVSFDNHRKDVTRFLKVLWSVCFFGRGKSKRQSDSSS
ncbi:BTB/POZ domain-containing protein At5g48130 [Impatiens glandulifera]|uniref:BTB/POZ domain-containing protein At5g48130 n=1 Tax=Impatiens glandulifera TaxID=253017 RepID=UPI001FB0B1CB|nr:BTB/POZ domain-containing protein At5g48130 [Impatiens glandulifera]